MVVGGGGEKSSSTKGCLSTKVVSHWRSSSTEGGFPPKVIFHQRLSSTECSLPPKVIYHRRSSSYEGHFSPNVILHRRSSSTKSRLPLTITPWLILYLWEQSTFQISAPYLKFFWQRKQTYEHTKRTKPHHSSPEGVINENNPSQLWTMWKIP